MGEKIDILIGQNNWNERTNGRFVSPAYPLCIGEPRRNSEEIRKNNGNDREEGRKCRQGGCRRKKKKMKKKEEEEEEEDAWTKDLRSRGQLRRAPKYFCSDFVSREMERRECQKTGVRARN
ncbi:hypothetical protein V1478_017974 [Vespula squamosa]|uniref:Uncharacterized protein n=1 Tax=Vespula squamosa TaxID=30214 RepID=A0ABD1ZVR6_VESSQ